MGERPYHVTPVADLMDHDQTEDCPCGPEVQAIFRDDGSNGWLIVHHSLDGREIEENAKPRQKGNSMKHIVWILTHPIYAYRWHFLGGPRG